MALHPGIKLQSGFMGQKIVAVFLLILSLAPLAFSRDEEVQLRIPPVRTTLNVEDQPVVISASGTITMTARQRDELAFRLNLTADLSGLQQNITPILRSALNKSDRCGERIEIEHATLTPADPAALVTAQLHYERWACVKIFGRQTPHRLVGGDAVVQMKLIPVVENYRSLRLQPELGTIRADGSLGELLRSGPFEQMLREKMSHSLSSAAEKGTNFTATLPPAAQSFATIGRARFEDAGRGRLAAVLDGEIHLNAQQAQQLKNQLQERAARAQR